VSIERSQYASLSGGLPRRFALFLRPFSINRRLAVANPYKSLGLLWPSAPAERNEVDLETLLADAFKSENPLIGLGKPGEAIGAGRVEVPESSWQLKVMKFAAAAEIILVIPASSEGTKWEITYLKQARLLTKCIFVMPPSRRREIAEQWEGSIDRLPIWMPPYSSRGMLFSLDAEGQLAKNVDLDVGSTRALVSRLADASQSPIGDLLTYKLTDQSLVRAVGFMGLYIIAPTILGILLVILLLMFSR